MIATLAEVVTPKSCAITPTRNFIWPSRSILLDCTLLKWIMKSSLCCIKCTPCCVACSCDHNEQNCDILSSVKRTYHLAEHYMLCVCNNGLVRHAMSGIFFFFSTSSGACVRICMFANAEEQHMNDIISWRTVWFHVLPELWLELDSRQEKKVNSIKLFNQVMW